MKSMTGYGGARSAEGAYKLSVEVRSVNNRYLDASVRLPRSFLFAEDAVKSVVQEHISRGKVDVFINFEAEAGENAAVTANVPLAASYKAAVDQIGDTLGIRTEVTAYDLCRLQDVLTLEKKDMDKQAALRVLLTATHTALADFDTMREREGQKMRDDLSSRLTNIESHISFIEERAPQTVAEYHERLTKKMLEILDGAQIDENRILAEAAIYADHIATDEETVRLRSHISQMRSLIASGEPVGRKLDFLVQELNRETNTIGSKCNDTDMTRAVLDMKSEIEKIREQVQNIE